MPHRFKQYLNHTFWNAVIASVLALVIVGVGVFGWNIFQNLLMERATSDEVGSIEEAATSSDHAKEQTVAEKNSELLESLRSDLADEAATSTDGANGQTRVEENNEDLENLRAEESTSSEENATGTDSENQELLESLSQS